MSSSHPPASDGHGGLSADDADHHVEAPPPEPESPVWLPLLGGALFLAALLLYLFTRPADEAKAEEPKAAEPKAAPAAKAAAPARVSPPVGSAGNVALRPRPLPSGAVLNAPRPLPNGQFPEQRERPPKP